MKQHNDSSDDQRSRRSGMSSDKREALSGLVGERQPKQKQKLIYAGLEPAAS